MPDPAALLAVARLLLDQPSPSDAHLRRAVPTAYYAVFHKVLRASAQRFMGSGKERSAGYALLYRSFDHHHMKQTCEALQGSTLRAKYQFNLGRSSVSQDLRDFVNAFPALQEARHLADYHPTVAFLPFEVSSPIDSAEVAMAAFDRIAADEQADFLALLMVRIRG